MKNRLNTKEPKLSKREKQILQMFQRGYKARIIASMLSIDQKTVATYKTRCKKKLGLGLDGNDYEMVHTGLLRGWIEQ